METGPNNLPIEPFTFLKRSGEKSNIQSVGLIFEPDFFTAYWYGDRSGQDLIGFSTLSRDAKLESILRKIKTEPLYALVYTPEWTLIPRSIVQEDDLERYLVFNTSADENDGAGQDSIPLLDATLIYKKETRAEELIENWRPGLQIKHTASAALELFLRSYRNSDQRSLHVHFIGNHVIIAVLAKEQLLFANAIHAKYFEDLHYYILFAAKQLDISSRDTILLSGHSGFSSKLKNLLAKSFENVRTPDLKDVNDGVALNEELRERHFLGIHTPLCA